MAELIFFMGLAGPFLLMIWLIRARRNAAMMARERAREETPLVRFATDEALEEQDGLTSARHHPADAEMLAPDHTGGEPAGIRALQGRR